MSVTLLSLAFQISLALIVFAYGLQERKVEDLRFLVARPRLAIVSLVALFVATPALALVLAAALPVTASVQVALVALSFSMVTPLLPLKEMKAGGHVSYGIGLVALVALVSPVAVPVLVWALGGLLGRPYGVDPLQVAAVTFGLVLVPLVAGSAFQALFPGMSRRVANAAPRIAAAIMLLALAVVVVVIAGTVVEFVTLWTVVAATLFVAGALAIGHVLGGPQPDQAVVLGLSCATRHPAIAFTIATANYSGRDFPAAVVVILVVTGVVTTLYVAWHRVRTAAGGATDAAAAS